MACGFLLPLLDLAGALLVPLALQQCASCMIMLARAALRLPRPCPAGRGEPQAGAGMRMGMRSPWQLVALLFLCSSVSIRQCVATDTQHSDGYALPPIDRVALPARGVLLGARGTPVQPASHGSLPRPPSSTRHRWAQQCPTAQTRRDLPLTETSCLRDRQRRRRHGRRLYGPCVASSTEEGPQF